MAAPRHEILENLRYVRYLVCTLETQLALDSMLLARLASQNANPIER